MITVPMQVFPSSACAYLAIHVRSGYIWDPIQWACMQVAATARVILFIVAIQYVVVTGRKQTLA